MRQARDAGYDGIELTLDAEGALGLTPKTTDDELTAIRKAADALGLGLPSVASSLYWAYSFTSDDASEREKAFEAASARFGWQRRLARIPY